jgi:hypothetical protein
MTRAQNLAVIVTCLLAAMAYAGAVTVRGLVTFVLPGVVAAAFFGSFLAARRKSGAALILGGVLILGWSELVNIWSGSANGPAARTSFAAAGWALVGVVVARSGSPAFFLATVAGSVCSALLLGAGGEVRSVAVAAVVSAALTLGWIERSRRNWNAPPSRAPALVVLSLLVGAVAVGAVLLQVQRDHRLPEALAAGQAYPGIEPPWFDPLGTSEKSLQKPPLGRTTTPQTGKSSQKPPPGRTRTPPPRPRTHPRVTKHVPSSSSTIWLYVIAGILLLLALVIAARLLFVRLAWRRLRRRLASGSPAEQVTGAWAWMRIRLEAYRLPLAASLSPDLVAAGSAGPDLPADAVDQLQTLAAVAATAAFSDGRSLAADDVAAAWTAAGRAEASVRDFRSKWTRVALALRRPALRVRPQ